MAVFRQFKVHTDALGCPAAATPKLLFPDKFLKLLGVNTEHSEGLFQANKNE